MKMRKLSLMVAGLALLIAGAAHATTITLKPPGGFGGGTVDCGGGTLGTLNSDGTYSCTAPATSLPYLMASGWAVVSPAYSLGNQSSTVALDLQNGCTQSMTLTGNVTLSFPLNVGYCKGSPVKLFFTQDGTGGRTVTYSGAAWKFANASPVVNAAVSGLDQIEFFDDGTNLRYPAVGTAPNFSALAVNGGTIGGCSWTVTLSSGAGTSSGTSCLAACTNVSIQGVAALNGGGPPTTLATPTSNAQNIACAQPSAGATVVKCLSSNGSGAQVVNGNCSN
jgi:hypothetical protein